MEQKTSPLVCQIVMRHIIRSAPRLKAEHNIARTVSHFIFLASSAAADSNTSLLKAPRSRLHQTSNMAEGSSAALLQSMQDAVTDAGNNVRALKVSKRVRVCAPAA